MANVSDEVLNEGCFLSLAGAFLGLLFAAFLFYTLSVGVPLLVATLIVGELSLQGLLPLCIGLAGTFLCRWEMKRIWDYLDKRVEEDMRDENEEVKENQPVHPINVGTDLITEMLARFCGWKKIMPTKRSPLVTWQAPDGGRHPDGSAHCPNYMHDGNAMLEVLETLENKGWDWFVAFDPLTHGKYECELNHPTLPFCRAVGEKPTEAVARAAFEVAALVI